MLLLTARRALSIFRTWAVRLTFRFAFLDLPLRTRM
jgi:hypothetical protein